MMVNHNEFGVTEDEFEEYDSDEQKVQELLVMKMKIFISRHPEVRLFPPPAARETSNMKRSYPVSGWSREVFDRR